MATQRPKVIFNAALTGLFAPTRAFLIESNEITFYFNLVVTVGTVSIEWYMEFTDNPGGSAPVWHREIAEEDAGSGVVLMPEVVRTFAASGGTTLPIGTHNLDAEFKRRNKFCRVQMRVTGAGAARAKVTIPFGVET